MRAHFQMQEKAKKFRRKGEFSPWTVIASNHRNHQKGVMGQLQSDRFGQMLEFQPSPHLQFPVSARATICEGH